MLVSISLDTDLTKWQIQQCQSSHNVSRMERTDKKKQPVIPDLGVLTHHSQMVIPTANLVAPPEQS